MPISFRCSQCNQLLRVPDTAAGKSARCPKCQALMTVPARSDAEPPAFQLEGAGAGPGPAAGWSPPQEAAAGSPAKPPGGVDPFPFLESPSRQSVPPPQAAGNPFADAGGSPFGGPATASLNPYASPATIGGFGEKPAWAAQRPAVGGRAADSIGCWFPDDELGGQLTD
jgi:phage FluMu protein Com